MGLIEVGTYVRTPDGVGYVFGKNGDQYEIALVKHDEELTCGASELTLYTGVEPVWSADAN